MTRRSEVMLTSCMVVTLYLLPLVLGLEDEVDVLINRPQRDAGVPASRLPAAVSRYVRPTRLVSQNSFLYYDDSSSY